MQEWLLGLFLHFAQNYPGVSTVIMVLGALRLIMKPLMALLQAIVEATPYDTDNKWLEDMKVSPFYTGLCFILDWVASVKLPSK